MPSKRLERWRIYELFGYPVSDGSEEARKTRASGVCPFGGVPCDGGGNRYQSFPTIAQNDELFSFFEGVVANGSTKKVPVGVCSLKTGNQRWVVCPRRLFTITGGVSNPEMQNIQKIVFKNLGLLPGTKLGVWSEVKIKLRVSGTSVVAETGDEVEDGEGGDDEAQDQVFDYTFDYVLMPLGKVSLAEAAGMLGRSSKRLATVLSKMGYTVCSEFVLDFPFGSPYILEVMTSSTSGGNKRKGTDMTSAFKKAMKEQGALEHEQTHEAPGINYRQVWARMVSQLVAKSEIALAWGGKAIWLVQGALMDYISATTKIQANLMRAKELNEVNILCLEYQAGSSINSCSEEFPLYAGPIRLDGAPSPNEFASIINVSFVPDIKLLYKTKIGKEQPIKIILIT